jgi:sugar/nucleoside kinase (ribokinase family)
LFHTLLTGNGGGVWLDTLLSSRYSGAKGGEAVGAIVTLGEILVEIMATEVGQTFRTPGRLAGPFPSGAPAIFIDQVARLGHGARIIGCVGDDDFGWLNIERLRRDGVDTSGVAVLKDAVTGSAFVTYDRAGERHFIFNITNSASARLSPSDVSEERLGGCTHVHVMGSSLFAAGLREATLKAIEVVTGQGGRVSFDPNVRPELLALPGMREALTSVLKRTDIFLPSGAELTLLTKAETEDGAVEELLTLGIREIVVKRGRHGCVYHDATRRLAEPALRVEEVDPTGAGDCFAATYVTCRDRGMPVDSSVRYACAGGARAVMSAGPMEGTAGFAELDALLASGDLSSKTGRA